MQHIFLIYFFSEMVRLHEFPVSIVFDRDTKFVGNFWRALWKKLGANLSFILAYHPQSDGQTNVVNCTLGNILRSLFYQNPKQWDLAIAQAEFAYNDTPNRSTGIRLFQMTFGMNPRDVYELRNLGKLETRSAKAEEFVEQTQRLQEDVKDRFQESSRKYKQRENMKRREKEFQVGDLVIVYLRKEIFPDKTYNKLKMRTIGLCRIVRKFSTNAYEIELPKGIGISPIFNVVDLYPYNETQIEPHEEIAEDEIQTLNWEVQMKKTVKREVDVFLEKIVSKRTRIQVYYQ